MTVSQNRFGGQATVGRRYVDEPYNPSPGVLAGAGLIAGGSGANNKSKKLFADYAYKRKQIALKQDRIRQDVKRLKPLHVGQVNSKASEAKFAGWLYGPEPKKRFQANIDGKRVVATGRGDAERVGGAINQNTLKISAQKNRLANEIRSSAKDLREAKVPVIAMGRKATKLKYVGRTGIGAGLAAIGGSIYANERSRGTFRSQRQAIGL